MNEDILDADGYIDFEKMASVAHAARLEWAKDTGLNDYESVLDVLFMLHHDGIRKAAEIERLKQQVEALKNTIQEISPGYGYY